jgi:lambda family phage portal protein
MLTQSPAVNQAIEREFDRWSDAIRLPEKLRTMRMALCVDGEAFALLTTNPKLSTEIKLDLRLIEADQVTTPGLAATDPNVVDGIVFDTAGNPVEYHVLREHPGDLLLTTGLEYDRVPAEFVIHLFRPDRPGQVRGIPELTPALPLFSMLRRYGLAVLGAAETAATFAGILYTDAPANGEAEDAEPFESIELEHRALVTMPSGWKMAQLEAQQPTTNHPEFTRTVLSEICQAVAIPYNVAWGDSSGHNYASGRLDGQTFAKNLAVQRQMFEQVVLDRILSAWLDEAVLIPELWPEPIGAMPDWPHQWFWNGQEHVDPLKEANAQEIRLRNHTTTLAHEYAVLGRDWEAEIRQRAREVELLRQLGLLDSAANPDSEPVTQYDVEPTDDAAADA